MTRKNRSEKSEPAAGEARDDVEGREVEELRRAEREGQRHIAEEDSEVEALLDDDDFTVDRGRD